MMRTGDGPGGVVTNFSTLHEPVPVFVGDDGVDILSSGVL